MSVVRTGRTVEWLVWQVATAADDELGPMYREDPVIPFAIDLETLPRYPLTRKALNAERVVSRNGRDSAPLSGESRTPW